MRLEFHGKSLDYNLDGSLKGTIVTLGHMGGGHLPVLLAGDQTALSNQELFELAMEEHYQENFPNRAENEKFNEQDGLIKEIKKAYEKVDETTKVISSTTLEIRNMVYGHEDILNQLLKRMGLKVVEDGTEHRRLHPAVKEELNAQGFGEFTKEEGKQIGVRGLT